MPKPTPLAALVKPEFIASIDTANEEVVRLVGQYNALVAPEGRLAKAENDLEAANQLLATAIKSEDLQAAKDAQAKAEKDLLDLQASSAKTIKELNEKADKAGAGAVAAIAASGVAAPAAVAATPALEKKSATDGLTGIARAIAANIELQKPKS